MDALRAASSSGATTASGYLQRFQCKTTVTTFGGATKVRAEVAWTEEGQTKNLALETRLVAP
jgi:hypothetical protein